MTNADMIRNMEDEELAELLYMQIESVNLSNVVYIMGEQFGSLYSVLQWLRRECK